MASYRPYPPPPAQNPVPVPPQPHPARPQSQYPPQSWGSAPPPFPPQNYSQMPPTSSFPQQYPYQPPPQQPPQQYQFQPPPPPPESSYAPPPLPPPNSVNAPPQQYFPSSQYSQFSQQQPPPPLQPSQPPPPPPPPPVSPPPSSAEPPPPPPPLSPPPPPPQSKESGHDRGKHERDRRVSRDGNHNQQNVSGRSQKPPMPLGAAKKANAPSGRVETEEERRLRKKKEMEKLEKQRQEEKRKHQLKELQQNPQKHPVSASGAKPHVSISGSRIGEKRAAPVMGADRDENPMKRQTAFMCRMKFRNELPDPSAQPKYMKIRRDPDRFTRYTITSLEKLHKPKLYVEPDLGIPLDLLDLSVYNPPREKRPLDPEDEELLRDDDPVTPLKKDGFKRKDRPSDQGVSWLVKTQYISPLSNEGAKQSLTEKQAKELREMKEGRNFLQNLNDRERQIKEIQASFEACKLRPVHATNKNLKPVEVLPLLPFFDRSKDQFVVANFDGEPTADAEMFSKLPKSARQEFESKAIMKSFTASNSDGKPDKFLGYMVPSQDELGKDIHNGHEDVSYTWVREYNWDVKGEDMDDVSTYFVSFFNDAARYMPLPTKIALRKRRAKEGKSQEEGEQFVPPGKLTVRNRNTTAVIERKESLNHSYSRAGPSGSRKGESDNEDDDREPIDPGDDDHMGHYSEVEPEEYLSD